MKAVHIIGVLVFLLLMVGSASACDYNLGNGKYSLSLEKSANTSTYDHVGQVIEYTYVVTNTGKMDLRNVKITDDHIQNGKPFGNFNLGEGDSKTYSTNSATSYRITQDDLTNGYVTNVAYATGTYKQKQVKSNEATVTIQAIRNPALILKKTASSETYSSEEDSITYAYEVTNSGDVVIYGPITVNDNKLGTVPISSSSISPGQTVTGIAPHKISQADLDAGYITNIAQATGYTYGGGEVKSNTDTVTVNKYTSPDTQIPEFPSIALPVASILGLVFISQYRKKEE